MITLELQMTEEQFKRTVADISEITKNLTVTLPVHSFVQEFLMNLSNSVKQEKTEE